MVFQLAAFADESSPLLSGQIDALKRNGYGFLEIRSIAEKNVARLSVQEAEEIKAKLEAEGLSVDRIGSPIGKIPIDGDFEEHLELLRHTLTLANVFGAKYLRLFSFFIPQDHPAEQYESLVIERMGKMAEISKSFGVTACHENEKGIYGDVADRCLQLHQAIPSLKAVFDPANFVQCGQDTLQAWEMLSPYVQYLHIKDALPDGQVVAPGQGMGNIKQIMEKYAAKGGRLLTLEPHLYEFAGIKSLEQKGQESLVGQMAFATAEEAFDYAAKELKNLWEGRI